MYLWQRSVYATCWPRVVKAFWRCRHISLQIWFYCMQECSGKKCDISRDILNAASCNMVNYATDCTSMISMATNCVGLLFPRHKNTPTAYIIALGNDNFRVRTSVCFTTAKKYNIYDVHDCCLECWNYYRSTLRKIQGRTTELEPDVIRTREIALIQLMI